MMTVTSGHQSDATRTKHLLFLLDSETYAVQVLAMKEVLSDYQLTALAYLPPFVHGVTSVRGQPVPVINLRHRLGLPCKKRDARSRVIILDSDPRAVGLEVDAVLRVASLDMGAMVEPPMMTGASSAPYLKGVVPEDGKFVIVLDTPRLVDALGPLPLREVAHALEKSCVLSTS